VIERSNSHVSEKMIGMCMSQQRFEKTPNHLKKKDKDIPDQQFLKFLELVKVKKTTK